MSAWANALRAHRAHASFRVQQWPFTREYGFTCDCSGCEHEWRIGIAEMRQMLPDAREALQRLYRHPPGSRGRAKAARKASVKAKALLHRHLTKEQRWELRATKAFTIVGQDGKTYRVTEGTANNVQLLVDGEPQYSLCVVFKDHAPMPMYDLMLAQKLLLELDIRFFLRTAHVVNLTTKAYFDNGLFLLEGAEPVELPEGDTFDEEIPDEDVDHPEAWVRARLTEAAEGTDNGDADDADEPAAAE